MPLRVKADGKRQALGTPRGGHRALGNARGICAVPCAGVGGSSHKNQTRRRDAARARRESLIVSAAVLAAGLVVGLVAPRVARVWWWAQTQTMSRGGAIPSDRGPTAEQSMPPGRQTPRKPSGERASASLPGGVFARFPLDTPLFSLCAVTPRGADQVGTDPRPGRAENTVVGTSHHRLEAPPGGAARATRARDVRPMEVNRKMT